MKKTMKRTNVSSAKRAAGKRAYKNIKSWSEAMKAYVKDHAPARKGTYEYGIFYRDTILKAKKGSALHKKIKSYMK